MSEPGERRGEKTREAILTAAEAVFAEHGFDGARIDTIADVSGFNKTLIFRYFGDKLGLYAAVLRRIDRQAVEVQAQLLGPLLADETLVSDAPRFRAFLTTAIGAFFDYLVEHPRLMRMVIWEHAEGWQTYAKIASLFELEGLEQLEALFKGAQQAGLLRSDGDPLVLFLLAEQICWSFLTSLPFYQMVLPTRDFSSAEALARARKQIVAFIVAGILVDPKDAAAERERRQRR
jgi:TetR/AcrR family transcriptional regulator